MRKPNTNNTGTQSTTVSPYYSKYQKRIKRHYSSLASLRGNAHREIIMGNVYHNAVYMYVNGTLTRVWQKYKKLTLFGGQTTGGGMTGWNSQNYIYGIFDMERFYFNANVFQQYYSDSNAITWNRLNTMIIYANYYNLTTSSVNYNRCSKDGCFWHNATGIDAKAGGGRYIFKRTDLENNYFLIYNGGSISGNNFNFSFNLYRVIDGRPFQFKFVKTISGMIDWTLGDDIRLYGGANIVGSTFTKNTPQLLDFGPTKNGHAFVLRWPTAIRYDIRIYHNSGGWTGNTVYFTRNTDYVIEVQENHIEYIERNHDIAVINGFSASTISYDLTGSTALAGGTDYMGGRQFYTKSYVKDGAGYFKIYHGTGMFGMTVVGLVSQAGCTGISGTVVYRDKAYYIYCVETMANGSVIKGWKTTDFGSFTRLNIPAYGDFETQKAIGPVATTLKEGQAESITTYTGIRYYTDSTQSIPNRSGYKKVWLGGIMNWWGNTQLTGNMTVPIVNGNMEVDKTPKFYTCGSIANTTGDPAHGYTARGAYWLIFDNMEFQSTPGSCAVGPHSYSAVNIAETINANDYVYGG